MKTHHLPLALCCLFPVTSVAQTSYYVAPGGNDITNNGSIGSPFASIQKGADMAHAGDTVFIRAGTYREDKVVVPRSGTNGNPITFTAYNGEAVVVSGGDVVSGWTLHDSSPANGDIWKANVGWDMGTDGVGNTLFENGVLKFEAREGAESDPMLLSNWGQIPSGKLTTTHFTASDLTGWGDDFWNGAKVRHHTHDWVITNSEIADYRSSDGKVTFVTPFSGVSQKHVIGYYIYDTIKALDQPGEWFKDRGTGTLYYMVPNGGSPSGIEFKARDYGFDVSGRDYIEIRGLTLRGLHIETDGNTDHNVYQGNTIYAYDKANHGRFWITGDHNVFRDNEVSQSWGSVVSIGGTGNQLVNNYLHDIGFNGTTRVITMSGQEHLVARNTVQKFARSFLDGYPYRSEFKNNLFEQGATLSWDTGVFDGDSGRGNGGGCTVHHNVFRNTDTDGIYFSFYAGLDLVVHHNIVHDMLPGSFRGGQLQFLKYYHNTIIGVPPTGNVNASSFAFESSYSNNIQVSTDEIASIGVENRGNHDYATSDFVDFSGKDFRLSGGSGAIDQGIVLPGINDGFAGSAPDAGALEFGETMWEVGHDFTTPPIPTYTWVRHAGTNLFENPLFSLSPSGWSYTNSPSWIDGNAWNTWGTGLSRSGGRCFQLNPGDGMQRTFTGLKPDTWYTIATETRLLDQVIEAEQTSGSSGAYITGSHRGETYVTGLDAGEWLRYDGIDFGAAGQYDQMELTYSRPPGTPVGDPNATLEVRIDSVGGTLLGTFEYNPNHSDVWITTPIDLSGVSGSHAVYLVPQGTGAGDMRLATVRLLQNNPEPDAKLTVGARNFNGSNVETRVGAAYWPGNYELISFKTGAASTTAEFFVQNDGLHDAYFDRLALFESGIPGTEVAGVGIPVQSSTLTTNLAVRAIDGLGTSSTAITEDLANSWWQVDLGSATKVHSIRLTAPTATPGQLSKFRVSVWNADPRNGGSPLWERAYLSSGTLGSGESIILKANELSADGATELQSPAGRHVRVDLLGQNNLSTGNLGIADVEVFAYDELDLVESDGVVTSGSDFWQATFAQIINPGEITLRNVEGGDYLELSRFTVSVWDRDPADGGSIEWEKDFFPTGSVAEGGTFVISGDEIGEDGATRLASVLGRTVRVENNGTNAAGNTQLSIADAIVIAAADVPPANNVALGGVATQSSNHYSNWGFADAAINGVVNLEEDFSSTLNGESNSWWEVDLQQTPVIDQIVIFNRNDAASRIGNFRVSVRDSGGTEQWAKDYSYSSGHLPAGGSLAINGNVTGDVGGRLDAVTNGRIVRIQHWNSEILSLPEVQVWKEDAVLRIDPAGTSLDFDLGTPDSPVRSGYTRVSPITTGDVWWDGEVSAIDRGTVSGVNDANRDFVHHDGPATLNIKLQDGVWDCTTNMGDASQAHDDMVVWAEDQLVTADADSAALTFPYVNFTVIVRDGELNLRYDDNGGSDPDWVLNRVSLTRTGDVPSTVEETVDPARTNYDYDFGTVDSPVDPGWTAITPNTVGDITWSTAVSAVDRGSGAGDLLRDFVFSGSTTSFEHLIANGTWSVVLEMGDDSFAHDQMAVSAEGIVMQSNISSGAGGFTTVSGTVGVADGALSLEFSDAGGDPDWVVNRLSLERISDLTLPNAPSSLSASADFYDNIALSWLDNANDESVYRIERKVGAGSWAFLVELPADTTSHTDTGLALGAAHSYRVYARSVGGDSTFSNTASATTQLDGDGIDDSWEIAKFGNVTTTSGAPGEDFDSDDLDDADEYALGTEPTQFDSDGDGLSDGSEEHFHSSDPLDADSDDDGYPDGIEVAWGSSPMDGGEVPVIPDLVAYYPFDEGSGTTANDLAVADGEQDGTQNQGGIGWTGSGLVGGALDLPGNASLVADDAIPAGTMAFTMSVWINPESTGGYKGVYTGRFGSGNWGLNMETTGGYDSSGAHSDNRFANQGGSSFGVDSPPDSISSGSGWHHLAITWETDGATSTSIAYLDGVAIGSPSTAANPAYLAPSVGYYIGDDPCCNSREFNGQIDDLAVLTRALSPDEIAAVHAAGQVGQSILTTLVPDTLAWTQSGVIGVPAGNDMSVTLEWYSTEVRTYSVWKSSTLDGVDWTEILSGIPGAPGGVTSRTVLVNGDRWFFRIGLEP